MSTSYKNHTCQFKMQNDECKKCVVTLSFALPVFCIDWALSIVSCTFL